MVDSWTPTKSMRDEAQRGLKWRQEFNRGGTLVGVARARDIVNGKDLPLDTVKRMASYFARHEVDKNGQGWSPDEDGYPSAGRIAWALWGGDPGRAWAESIISQNEGRNLDSDGATMNQEPLELRELDIEQFNSRQAMQYEHDEHVVELFGKYDQGIGPDGAHYVAVSPFADEGLVCSNCAFYEGPRGCEIVDGDIDPNGVCKRWIIPAALVTPSEPAPMNTDDIVRYGALDIEHRKIGGRDVEFRTVSAGRFEVRSTDGQPMTFRGYAAVFNSPSEPLPFTETIRPGAFRRSLNSGREVRVFVNHNTDMVLGSTRSGTFNVAEDERGLFVEGELPDTTYGRDLSVLMQRGDVDSMSFGFSIPRGGDSWSDDGSSRELREIILHEVSIVTGFPAYPDTAGASVRNTDTDPEDDGDETLEPAVPVAVLRRLNDLYARRA